MSSGRTKGVAGIQEADDHLIPPLALGGFVASEARSAEDLGLWFDLRCRSFRGGAVSDRDRFDDLARVVLVRDRTRAIAAGFRLFIHPDSAAAQQGYTGQFYDFAALSPDCMPSVEFGRVCLADRGKASTLVRLILAVLTHVVDASGAGLLFGAASFAGADVAAHAGGLTWLRENHLGPEDHCPRTFRPVSVPDAAADADAVPALLRAYLSSGAFVGPGAVADPDLDTLHVFTALAPRLVPEARARVLRALAQQAQQRS